MRIRDWSSDVCSSDLDRRCRVGGAEGGIDLVWVILRRAPAFEQRGGAQCVLQPPCHGLGALRAECELAGGTGLVGVGDGDVVAGGHVFVRLCRGSACAGVYSAAPTLLLRLPGGCASSVFGAYRRSRG